MSASPDPRSSKDVFSDFLSAIKDSSTRTRSIMFVNILLSVLTLSLVINFFYPAWEDRIQHFGYHIAHCLDVSTYSMYKDDEEKSKCETDLKLVSDEYYDKGRPHQFIADAIVRHLDGIVDNVTRHEQFEIPFFNIYLHENDMWIVSGVLGLVSLLLLSQYMTREGQVLNSAIKYIITREQVDLVLATQVFSATEIPDTELNRDQFGRYIIRFMFMIPVILHSIVVVSDLTTFGATERHLGQTAALVLLMIEAISLLAMASVAARCFTAVRATETSLEALSKKFP